MKRIGVFSALGTVGFLAMSAATVMAQTPAQNGNPSTVLITAPLGNCPVGISARRGLGVGAVAVDNDKPDRNGPNDRINRGEASQQLQILMLNLKAVGVTGAQITAHGTAPGAGRVIPAGDADGATATQTVYLKLAVGAGGEGSTDVRFRGFTSISLLDLDAVSFADGTSWHSAAGHTCEIVPSRFMLVNSQAK